MTRSQNVWHPYSGAWETKILTGASQFDRASITILNFRMHETQTRASRVLREPEPVLRGCARRQAAQSLP